MVSALAPSLLLQYLNLVCQLGTDEKYVVCSVFKNMRLTFFNCLPQTIGNTVSYTLGEAAKAVGKSKATLSKAIKNGKISASKKEDGSFSIEPSELHRVYPPTPTETVSGEQKETSEETHGNSHEIIELRVKLEAAQQRISDLEEDRNQWRQQANRLLSHTPQTPPSPSLWQRIFGKT